MKQSLLNLLINRLTWPSCTVKERAAREIAGLLGSEKYRRQVYLQLSAWISEQTLESLAVYGLLCFVRAKLDGVSPGLIDPPRLARAIKKPSILSTLILEDVFGLKNATPAGHAATAPKNFREESFFSQYVSSFLPPYWKELADQIESKASIRFLRQWAYEWKALLNLEELRMSPTPGEYWGHRRLGKGNTPWDTKMSEIYRSAFLRTLAWATGERPAEKSLFSFAAQRMCPIDTGLWLVEPAKRPQWWPNIPEVQTAIDEAPGFIQGEVEKLWRRQENKERWEPNTDLGGEFVLGEATGLVVFKDRPCELHISAAFQKCTSGKKPDLKLISKTMTRGHEDAWPALKTDPSKRLSIEGKLKAINIGDYVREVAGWEIAPVSMPYNSQTIHRWQYFRVWYGLWAPSPFIFGSSGEIECSKASINIKKGGQLIGQWQDWIETLKSTNDDKVPFPAGQFLSVRRSAVEAFTKKTLSVYCWVCRITSYHGDRWGDKMQSVSHEFVLGESSIITEAF